MNARSPAPAPFADAGGERVHASPDEALELVFARAFHAIVCSTNMALHPDAFLDALASEDAAAADRVLVLAPALDAAFVHEELLQAGRNNTVLATPLEESAVRREVARAHPDAGARVAVAEIDHAPPPRFPHVAYRRLAVLVVDDDPTTEILFAAAERHPSADVAFAKRTMEAFEHCMVRPVDVLIIGATMRGEGGEPVYRLLWRLQPELKRRTVLVVPSDMPPQPRVLPRPVTQDAIGRVVAEFHARPV